MLMLLEQGVVEDAFTMREFFRLCEAFNISIIAFFGFMEALDALWRKEDCDERRVVFCRGRNAL